MKYIKKYETIEETSEPQIGDYAICYDNTITIESQEYMKSHIGQITDIYTTQYNKKTIYSIQYFETFRYTIGQIGVENSAPDFNVYKEDIIFFSPNKEEVELSLQANKYNL